MKARHRHTCMEKQEKYCHHYKNFSFLIADTVPVADADAQPDEEAKTPENIGNSSYHKTKNGHLCNLF